ncbi:FkbM family methyltransferase [Roseinatronobacter sp. NSM]
MDPFNVAGALARVSEAAQFYDLRGREGRKLSARQLRQLFYGLQRALQPAHFVEAGAHNAATSLKIREVSPQTSVTAFEANPYNFKKFASQTNFAAAGVDYRLNALTDHEGPVTFNVLIEEGGVARQPASGRSSLLTRTDATARHEEVTVTGTTLDACFSDQTGTLALWVDVEGAAGKLLAGAARTLPRIQSLMIEVETRAFWSGQWLHTDICAHLMGAGLIPVARDFEFRHQFNILFLHPDALAHAHALLALEQFYSARARP